VRNRRWAQGGIGGGRKARARLGADGVYCVVVMGVVDVTVVALFGMLALLIGIEHAWPVRAFEEVPGWRLKCVGFIPVVLGISVTIPYLMAGAIGDVKLLDGERLGVVGGTVVGIVLSELVVYWAHRLHHRVPFLWRWIHQLHHSAERVDVFGAAYFHPFEIMEGTVVGVLMFNVVLGLAPEAAFLAVSWQAFSGVFQHGNIRTPTWLGYVIQRPEAHAVHHERGVHGFNYANLPIWDIVFGTFRNPVAWQGTAGFYSGASRQTLRMLIGRDVSRERA
jgi:sterol desaturase/sphingolipid hydroxylase (fatty acid hydroxylase superfamily)